MALVPWPDDAGERTAAVAVIVAAAGIDESVAGRLGPVSSHWYKATLRTRRNRLKMNQRYGFAVTSTLTRPAT